MLPVKDNSKLSPEDKSSLLTIGEWGLGLGFQNGQHQHLYIFSSDIVKENQLKAGDYIHTSNVPIERVKAIDKNYHTNKGYEWLITVEGNGNQYKPCEIFGQVIASTDKSLYTLNDPNYPKLSFETQLPTIPESFLILYKTAYNEGNVIKKVYVEMGKYQIVAEYSKGSSEGVSYKPQTLLDGSLKSIVAITPETKTARGLLMKPYTPFTLPNEILLGGDEILRLMNEWGDHRANNIDDTKLATEILFESYSNSITVSCPDEDSQMSVKIDDGLDMGIFCLTLEEAKAIGEFLLAHVKNTIASSKTIADK